MEERELYSDWNMAGFSWSGTFYRDEHGEYHVTEYNPDFEETGDDEYTYYDFSPSEMLDYAIDREDSDGEYGWGDDLSPEQLYFISSSIDLGVDDFWTIPRSLSLHVIELAAECEDISLLSYAKQRFKGEDDIEEDYCNVSPENRI